MMSQEDDRIKSLSDEDVELEQKRMKAFPNHPIHRELISRKIARERAALELAEAANSEARKANEAAREALRITREAKIIALIAITIAIASFIVMVYPPK